MAEWLKLLIFSALNGSSSHRCGFRASLRSHVRRAKFCFRVVMLFFSGLHQSFQQKHNWAATWQNQQIECAPIEDSDQPGIRPVWSESSLCAQWVAKDPSFLDADSKDWSDWVDAQAGLSLGWAHTHFVGFVVRFLSHD